MKTAAQLNPAAQVNPAAKVRIGIRRGPRTALTLCVLLTAAAARSSESSAQEPFDIQAIASWLGPDVATGYETRGAPRIADAMEGWEVDQWGNVVRVIGSGSPRRVIACALDRPALSASQITDDGYLRVHRIGRGSAHPLWDQAFEAQQVRVLTPTGPVAGVVARSNGHFAAQHRDETSVVGADDLWVDVGATSAADVSELGIGLLDPIVRHLPPWTVGEHVAGHQAGRRAGCAVVASLGNAAAQVVGGSSSVGVEIEAGRDPSAGAAETPDGQTHFVLTAQEGFGWVGLSSYVARGGLFDEIVMLAPGSADGVVERRDPAEFGRMGAVLEEAGVASVTWIVPEVRSPGAHMEVIAGVEVRRMLDEAGSALGLSITPEFVWVSAPAPEPLQSSHFEPAVADVARVLTDLVELHAVPGHEWSVRRYVLESLPGWARERAVVDDIGDVWVEAGPERDTTVFMAHMDEVGYEVESIAPDGVISLSRRGGAVSSAWEGQTALLHFDPPVAPSTSTGDGSDTDPRWKAESFRAEAREPISGVFLTRDEAIEKDPPPERAWFGLNRAELEARGVRVGMGVTSHKEGLRMGRTRFVARALDDRAGTTALLMAVNAIDPDELTTKVIFSWSVHEEGGLTGAGAMARRFGRSTVRIYSVDTFVSSDTPLEEPHFAYAPLGDGPVLRATENSGVSPDRERARVFEAAEGAGIDVQMGLTQGGTDGTQFTYWGAPNQGLSWPGRYSHSPGEVLDLVDLSQLVDLIRAVALADGSR